MSITEISVPREKCECFATFLFRLCITCSAVFPRCVFLFYFTLYCKLLPHVIKNFFENIFYWLHIFLAHSPLRNSNARKCNESACWILSFFPFFPWCFSIVLRSLSLFLNPPLLVFAMTSPWESVFLAFSTPTHGGWGLQALSREPVKSDHLCLEVQGLCKPACNSHPASAPHSPCFWNRLSSKHSFCFQRDAVLCL